MSILGCTHKKHTKKNSLIIKQLSRKLEPPHATYNKTAPPNFKFWLCPYFSQHIRIILWVITRWCKVLQKNNPCILWPGEEIALVHHILYRSYCAFTPRVLWPRSFLIFTIDELKNFAANNLAKVGVLVTY